MSDKDRPIWDLVMNEVPLTLPGATGLLEDMRSRDALGRRNYGTPLLAHNGRNALQDAYEESLDKIAYLRQAFEEGHNTWGMYQNEIRSAARLREMVEEKR